MSKAFEIALWVVLGATVFLGIIKFVFHLGFLLLLKGAAKIDRIVNAVQPRRVNLLPRDRLDWTNPEEIARILQELEQAGFVDAGRFEVKELKGTQLQALIHEEHCMAAVIYDHKTISMLDLLVDYEDGRHVCYANHKLGFSMARPENHLQKNFPGVSTTELLSRLRDECPAEGRQRIPTERFAFWYEEQYAEHARWLAERGGPTFEETAQMVVAGGNKADDAVVRELYESSAQGYLKNWFRDQPDVTDNVWASALFKNFENLSRLLTCMHYRQDLGLEVAEKHLIPVEQWKPIPPPADQALFSLRELPVHPLRQSSSSHRFARPHFSVVRLLPFSIPSLTQPE